MSDGISPMTPEEHDAMKRMMERIANVGAGTKPTYHATDSVEEARVVVEQCESATEMRPCPFCGSKYVDVRWIGPTDGSYAGGFSAGYRAECVDCFANTGSYMSSEDARKAWNGRAEQ